MRAAIATALEITTRSHCFRTSHRISRNETHEPHDPDPGEHGDGLEALGGRSHRVELRREEEERGSAEEVLGDELDRPVPGPRSGSAAGRSDGRGGGHAGSTESAAPEDDGAGGGEPAAGAVHAARARRPATWRPLGLAAQLPRRPRRAGTCRACRGGSARARRRRCWWAARRRAAACRPRRTAPPSPFSQKPRPSSVEQHHRRERVVDLADVDVVGRDAGPLERERARPRARATR